MLASLVLVASVAVAPPVGPRGHAPEPSLDRWEEASDEVEALLKKKLCAALRSDARLVEGLLAGNVDAVDPAAAVRAVLAEGPPYAVETVTFDGARRAASGKTFAEALEAYLAPIAIRQRCSIGFHRFVLSKSPDAIADASFELLVAGTGHGGERLLDHGEVHAELTRGSGKGPEAWRFEKLDLEPRQRVRSPWARFVDVTQAAGIPTDFQERIPRGLFAFVGDDLDRGGLAVADVDGDGDLDAYVSADGPNLLLLNDGKGAFTDAAKQWGVADGGNGRGVLLADLDGDGDPELLVANRAAPDPEAGRLRGRLVLYRNDGGRFTKLDTLGKLPSRAYMHLSAADVDGDGDLDVHAAAYGVLAGGFPGDYLDTQTGEPDLLLINEGAFKLVDRAKAWGVADRGWTLATTLVDLDGDGRPELVAADDFGRKRIYRNDGGKRFVDVSSEAGFAKERANGMGVAVGDVDGDGALDVYFANMHSNAGSRLATGYVGGSQALRERIAAASAGNTLWLGSAGNLAFREAGIEENLADGGWAYGVQLFDADDDGDLDAFSPCGFLTTSNVEDQ